MGKAFPEISKTGAIARRSVEIVAVSNSSRDMYVAISGLIPEEPGSGAMEMETT